MYSQHVPARLAIQDLWVTTDITFNIRIYENFHLLPALCHLTAQILMDNWRLIRALAKETDVLVKRTEGDG
jgi:hypothetical protein